MDLIGAFAMESVIEQWCNSCGKDVLIYILFQNCKVMGKGKGMCVHVSDSLAMESLWDVSPLSTKYIYPTLIVKMMLTKVWKFFIMAPLT